jgi:hypothetical protein
MGFSMFFHVFPMETLTSSVKNPFENAHGFRGFARHQVGALAWLSEAALWTNWCGTRGSPGTFSGTGGLVAPKSWAEVHGKCHGNLPSGYVKIAIKNCH